MSSREERGAWSRVSSAVLLQLAALQWRPRLIVFLKRELDYIQKPVKHLICLKLKHGQKAPVNVNGVKWTCALQEARYRWSSLPLLCDLCLLWDRTMSHICVFIKSINWVRFVPPYVRAQGEIWMQPHQDVLLKLRPHCCCSAFKNKPIIHLIHVLVAGLKFNEWNLESGVFVLTTCYCDCWWWNPTECLFFFLFFIKKSICQVFCKCTVGHIIYVHMIVDRVKWMPLNVLAYFWIRLCKLACDHVESAWWTVLTICVYACHDAHTPGRVELVFIFSLRDLSISLMFFFFSISKLCRLLL